MAASLLGATPLLVNSAYAALPLFGSQPDAQGAVPSLAPMLKQVNPAVVNIATYTTRSVADNPLLNDPFFRRFFNIPEHAPMQQRQQQRRAQAAGSGVVIDAKNGTVITNNHVVDGADEVKIILNDGRTFAAKVVGTDPEADIAVLHVDADKLSEIRVTDSDRLEVGDFVVAIGNPFGLGQTVTTGVVSALGRTGLGIEGYENFIQTDASINPGNSGGALVNLKGELVGINTAILAPSGGNVGIGFAIPINMVKVSVDQILKHGEVRRGQLGIIIQDLTPELADAFNLKSDSGVLVSEVQPGSAAEKAGIKAGDVVTEIDGKKMASAGQLRNEIGLRQIGDTVKVGLARDGGQKVLEVKIGGVEKQSAKKNQSVKIHKFLEGASLRNAKGDKGVVVDALEYGSPASRSGLREGDVIIGANRREVHNLDELQDAAKRSDSQLLLRIQRGNAALYLVIQ
ncbi:predicted trypsin-like serine protease [gamma proteobacterium HdN1]|nr:predicted trypsin-like serine protease [gamma proteobacterium HdN1]